MVCFQTHRQFRFLPLLTISLPSAYKLHWSSLFRFTLKHVPFRRHWCTFSLKPNVNHHHHLLFRILMSWLLLWSCVSPIIFFLFACCGFHLIPVTGLTELSIHFSVFFWLFFFWVLLLSSSSSSSWDRGEQDRRKEREKERGSEMEEEGRRERKRESCSLPGLKLPMYPKMVLNS